MKEIIRVENLSKAYRIGQKQQSHDTLFGKMADMVKAPLRNLKNLRSLTRFNGDEDPTVHWALKDINFTVHEGEVLGIIGHNGAGKSTLLKILSRVTEPTTGRITIHGRVGALLEVGTGFHPELTGRENIYMNGTILGMTKKEIDRKLDEIVDFSGVEKYIDTPVKFYSSGMKVRLGFAVAANMEPEILIIDEVLAVGDIKFQKKCLGKMEDVTQSKGKTVLFVSHNMAAIQSICKRAMVLEKGSVLFNGELADSINYYYSSLRTNSRELTNNGLLITFSNESLNFNGKSVIDYDQPFRLSCLIHLSQKTKCSVFLILKTGNGETLVHERVDDVLFLGNIRKITFSFPPLWLRPGVYNYYFKVISFEGSSLRYISEIFTMEVKGNVSIPKILGQLVPKCSIFVD